MSKRIIAIMTAMAMLVCMLAVVPLPAANADGSASAIRHVEVKIDPVEVLFQGDSSLPTGSDVTMVVTDPQGGLDYINQTVSGPGGEFLFHYVPSAVMSGSYTFKVGGEGLETPYAGSFQLSEETSPTATLTGPTAVLSGQQVDLKVGVRGSQAAFSILNVVLNYDPNHLNFETVTENGRISLAENSISSMKSDFEVLVTGVKPEKGQIFILMSSIGAENTVTGGNLLAVHAKASSVSDSLTTHVQVSDAAVSSDGTRTDLTGGSLDIQISPVNKETLSILIAAAQNKHDLAVEGTQAGQYPSGSKQSLQQAINDAKAVADNETATEAEVQAAVTSLNAALQAFLDAVNTTTDPGPVDKTQLSASIEHAQNIWNAAVAGTKVGQYPTESKAALQTAIAEAKAVQGRSSATQSQVNAAKEALDAAIQLFAGSIITLIPGETKISINDLSVIAKYYGTTSADENWSQIEKADLFDSGIIDIRVLASVARMIVDDWLSEE